MCNSIGCNPGRFDNIKAEAFAYKMMSTLNSAAVAFMVSIGHRTRLFDIMATLEPSTSEQIAHGAGLNERYVREWLGAMVSGRIVAYDPESRTYCLPAEHAAFLTREASPNNIAVTAQYFAVLGSVEDKVVECFQTGGGVPYSAYPRFHEVMAEESAQTTVSGLFDAILPLVPGLDDRLHSGIDVLDIGCGRGKALIAMAQRYPNSRFTGYDLSTEAIASAVEQTEQLGLTNLKFAPVDLTHWSEESAFDLVTAFDAIHDQSRPDIVLDNINRALRDDGVFLMQDIAASSNVENNIENPLGAFIYTISCMHCMTVSLAQGGLGLGAAWGEELARSMLAESGFEHVTTSRLEHDIQNTYFVARKRQEKATRAA
ncbi:MAG: class I SAM-dependent methyltransferase [candidate division Zixibacteria bacterium]|jgi:SAM-dependent methyltransferase|nr:class I SAM-dependent methyltransferase [candidate division Zixibacteria bacterium]